MIPPPGIHIITRDELNRSTEISVSQVLQAAPGVSVENSISRGNINPVYLRGAEANYTLVLIDGIRVNDSNGVVAMLSIFPP